jgi:hypothetical protein
MTFRLSLFIFYLSQAAFDDICHEWISQLPFCMFSLRFFYVFPSKSLVRIWMNFTISSRKIFVMIFICWILLFYFSHDAFDDIGHDWISQVHLKKLSPSIFDDFCWISISLIFCSLNISHILKLKKTRKLHYTTKCISKQSLKNKLFNGMLLVAYASILSQLLYNMECIWSIFCLSDIPHILKLRNTRKQHYTT